MFLVGMFEFRRIYNAIVRPEEGKTNGDGGCYAQGRAQGGKYSLLLELEARWMVSKG
jgi:hypothetical protein